MTESRLSSQIGQPDWPIGPACKIGTPESRHTGPDAAGRVNSPLKEIGYLHE